MIPPLAILPILFIVFGLGELSKIMLIVIGIAPFLIRDLRQRVARDPARAAHQGADARRLDLAVIALRVVLPQVLPRLIQACACRSARPGCS